MEHIWSGILDFEKEYPFKAKNVMQTSFKHCAPHIPPASNTSNHTKKVLVAVDRKHPMTAGCTDLMMIVLKKGRRGKVKRTNLNNSNQLSACIRTNSGRKRGYFWFSLNIVHKGWNSNDKASLNKVKYGSPWHGDLLLVQQSEAYLGLSALEQFVELQKLFWRPKTLTVLLLFAFVSSQR